LEALERLLDVEDLPLRPEDELLRERDLLRLLDVERCLVGIDKTYLLEFFSLH
jgi:hypothetical protein